MPDSPQNAAINHQHIAVTRDSMPLPEAARRVIRDQRGGGEAQGTGHATQAQQRDSAQPIHAGRRVLAPHLLQAHGSFGGPRQPPTLQEMYNTWRSLESQFSQMRRLPMFVKAELKFCHGCRILKVRCECFDYSQLEAGYQEKDRALRNAALHDFLVEEDDKQDEKAAETSSPSTEPAVGTPPSNISSPTTYTTHQIVGAGNSSVRNAQAGVRWSPAEVGSSMDGQASGSFQQADTRAALSDPNNQAVHALQSPLISSFDFNDGMTGSGPVVHAAEARMVPTPARARQGTPVPTSASPQGPTLVKFELRTIIMAKEKITAHSRRWQCRFGLTDNPADPVCKREDDNMETIRRHYGREHGSHRFHKRPTLRICCSHCDLEYDKQRPPIKCPGCKVDRGIWLREIFAVIEVPVPLDSHDQVSNANTGGPGNGGGSTDPNNGDNGSGGINSATTHGGFGVHTGMHGAGHPGSSGSPSAGPGGSSSDNRVGPRGGRAHRVPCRRRVDNPTVELVVYDPYTNMPECYNDISNNTTPLPVMPPPNIFVTDGVMPRPSSSSSASTAQSHAGSPFTQGFYTLSHGLTISPAIRMSHPSPSSPASNDTGGTYDTDTMAMIPAYNHLPGAALTGQPDVVNGMIMDSAAANAMAYGGLVGNADNSGVFGNAGVVGGVRDVTNDSNGASGQVTSYTDMLDMAVDDVPIQDAERLAQVASRAQVSTASASTQPGAAGMAEFEMFINLAARHAQAASSPAPPTTPEAPMGKCSVESEYFYFND